MKLPGDNLVDRVAHAGRWRFAGAMVGAAAQFLVSVVLARLLAPDDFGVMALAAVILGFMQPVGDFGIGGALIQRAELTDRHVRTAFTFSTIFGIAIASILAIAAPLGGVMMGDPRVTSVLRILAIGFAFRGAATTAGALLRQRLDFKRQFFIDVGSYVIGYGLVAVILARQGHGVWSMVWGGLSQALLSSTAQLLFVRHPLRPLAAWGELRDLLRFGCGSTLSNSVNYVALNGDNFVVGRLIGAAGLGLYYRAYSLMNLPFTYASNVMSSVLFPAFSKVQGQPVRLQRGYLLTTQIASLIAAPMMATLAVVSPYLVRSLYGSQWTGAVIPLQILCIAGYFRALYHLGGIVAQSVGKVYGELRNQLLYAAAVVGGALLGTRYGLPGVAVGVSLAIVIMFVATGRLALRSIGASWSDYFRVQQSGLIAGAATCASAMSVRWLLEARGASPIVITCAVLAGAGVPWGTAVVWKLSQPDFQPLRTQLPRWAGAIVDGLARRLPPYGSDVPVVISTVTLKNEFGTNTSSTVDM